MSDVIPDRSWGRRYGPAPAKSTPQLVDAGTAIDTNFQEEGVPTTTKFEPLAFGAALLIGLCVVQLLRNEKKKNRVRVVDFP